jgi:hypothetical protein
MRIRLNGGFDDAGFRQIVLLLLLASGILQIVPASIFSNSSRPMSCSRRQWASLAGPTIAF